MPLSLQLILGIIVSHSLLASSPHQTKHPAILAVQPYRRATKQCVLSLISSSRHLVCVECFGRDVLTNGLQDVLVTKDPVASLKILPKISVISEINIILFTL